MHRVRAESRGKVRTNDLVDKLQVSSEAIRRCMEELEEQNRLKQVYGGAVKVDLAPCCTC